MIFLFFEENNRRPLIAPESVSKLSATMHDQMNCSPLFRWHVNRTVEPATLSAIFMPHTNEACIRWAHCHSSGQFVLDETAWSFGAEVAFDGEMMLKHTRFSMEPSGVRMLEQCYTRRITEKWRADAVVNGLVGYSMYQSIQSFASTASKLFAMHLPWPSMLWYSSFSLNRQTGIVKWTFELTGDTEKTAFRSKQPKRMKKYYRRS